MSSAVSLSAADKTGITSAAPLSTAPAYGGSNEPIATLTHSTQPRWLLITLDVSGAGTGTIAVTMWYADPARQVTSIADDRGLSGVWTTSYAGTASKRSIMVEWPGCDIGFTATVSAVNITAAIRVTALHEA